MASIRKEVTINAAPEVVWEAFRDFGAVHRRVSPGFVIDCVLEGDVRVLTFANGLQAREQLVTMDDDIHRLAYTTRSERLAHHNGVHQIVPDGKGGSRFQWTIDLLPDELAPAVAAMMDDGLAAAKRTLERSTAKA